MAKHSHLAQVFQPTSSHEVFSSKTIEKKGPRKLNLAKWKMLLRNFIRIVPCINDLSKPILTFCSSKRAF